MESLSRVIIVIIVACAVIGCAPPIGGIGGSVDANLDELTAVPKRTTYNIPQKFLRDVDLTVFTNYRGVLRKVPIDQVDISIVEDLNAPERKMRISPDPTEPYPFDSKGQKMILVEYNDMSDTYYIDVTDPLEMGGGGGGTGDAPGIEIIWKPRW